MRIRVTLTTLVASTLALGCWDATSGSNMSPLDGSDAAVDGGGDGNGNGDAEPEAEIDGGSAHADWEAELDAAVEDAASSASDASHDALDESDGSILDSGDPGESDPPPPPPPPPPPATTFAQAYAIISERCAFCHTEGHIGQGLGHLDLSSAELAYANLVGKPADGVDCGGLPLTRVVPGQPDSSLILHKLLGTAECGVQMPDNFPPLDPQEIDVIRKWIAAGAKHD